MNSSSFMRSESLKGRGFLFLRVASMSMLAIFTPIFWYVDLVCVESERQLCAGRGVVC